MKHLQVTLAFSVILLFGVAACDTSPTDVGGPDAGIFETSQTSLNSNAVVRSTEDLLPGDPTIEGAQGSVSLTRTPSGGLSWQLEVSGMVPGNAYTIWMDGGGVGHAAGGLVDARGNVRAAGNHCISAINPPSFGFDPGASTPDCDVIDTDGDVALIILDHGEWTPGDMDERWLAGDFPFMLAFFGAP